MLDSILLRTIPAALKAGVASGDYAVFGSVVREATTGRIVGHLQETGLLSTGLSFVTKGPLGLVGDAVAVVQNEQIKFQNEQIQAAVAAVHNLQYVQLALGFAGIGVSVAGFAVMLKKVERLERGVAAVDASLSKLSRSVDLLRNETLEMDFAALRTAAERQEEGWHLRDGRPHWQSLASDAHLLRGRFLQRAEAILDHDPLAWPEAQPFFEALQLASSLRITARIAADELTAARHAAEDAAKTALHLCDRTPMSAVHLAAIEQGEPASFAEPRRAIHARIRTMDSAAVSLVETLSELDRQAISGRDWLNAARLECEQPFLFLPVREPG